MNRRVVVGVSRRCGGVVPRVFLPLSGWLLVATCVAAAVMRFEEILMLML